MDNTIIQQGTFTSTGVNKTLVVRSDVDWMRIINLTQAAASNNGYGYEYFWHRSMPLTTPGMIYYHPAGDHTSAVNMLTTGNGFLLVDSSTATLGASVATTASTNATQPVVSTGSTAGLTTGTIVRKIDTVTPQYNLNGLDFSIDTVINNTSFRLANTLATAPGVAGGAGTYRIVAPDLATYKLFQPSTRIISNITQATSAVVTTLVDHGYSIGDKVRFVVPGDRAAATMTQINNLIGTITAVTASTFTVDINTTAFTAFSFPIYTAVPCLYPQVVPVGESTNPTDPATNQGYIGMILTAGTASPAGSNTDVIVWMAGKSFNV